jgi:acetylornithine deacetylase
VRNSLEGASEPRAVPFGTEAGQFQHEGWSTVVCGPGEIAQAHKADEFIEQEQIARCHTLLSRAVARQCQLE